MDTKHLAMLQQMTDNKIIVMYGRVHQSNDDICDAALESTLGRMLLFSKLSPRRVTKSTPDSGESHTNLTNGLKTTGGGHRYDIRC